MKFVTMLLVLFAGVSSHAIDLCQFSEETVAAAESQVHIAQEHFSDLKCQGFHLYRMLRTAEYRIYKQYGEGALSDYHTHPVYRTISDAVRTVWTVDHLRNTPIPANPKVTYQSVIERYSAGFEAYFNAAMDAEMMRLGARYGTAEDVIKYSMSYGIFERRMKTAMSNWDATGYKRQLDQIARSL